MTHAAAEIPESESVMKTKRLTWKELKQGTQKRIDDQQQKTLDILAYLVEAQREVLEYEVGVLEDILKLIKAGAPTRQTSVS